jgi:hypothetical protein
MGNNDEIRQELSHICDLLNACLEHLIRIQQKMLDNEVCGICQNHIADSVCNSCGINLCTTCEVEHRHIPLPGPSDPKRGSDSQL